jgi:hypothetical protein
LVEDTQHEHAAFAAAVFGSEHHVFIFKTPASVSPCKCSSIRSLPPERKQPKRRDASTHLMSEIARTIHRRQRNPYMADGGISVGK